MGHWFDLEHMESDRIEGNNLYRGQTFEGEETREGLTVLQHRILIEEFYHFEKIKNDFIVFFTKFFDNTKTNIYKKVIKEYQEQVGKSFFSFFFEVINRFSYLFDFSKIKKNLIAFIKMNLETSNDEVIQLFIDYFKDNIHAFATATRETTSRLTPAGRLTRLPRLLRVLEPDALPSDFSQVPDEARGRIGTLFLRRFANHLGQLHRVDGQNRAEPRDRAERESAEEMGRVRSDVLRDASDR